MLSKFHHICTWSQPNKRCTTAVNRSGQCCEVAAVTAMVKTTSSCRRPGGLRTKNKIQKVIEQTQAHKWCAAAVKFTPVLWRNAEKRRPLKTKCGPNTAQAALRVRRAKQIVQHQEHADCHSNSPHLPIEGAAGGRMLTMGAAGARGDPSFRQP